MAFPHHAFMFPPLEDHHNNHLPSPSCPPQLFNGGGASFMMKRSVSEEVHMEDELSDDGSHLGEKKKRLNLEQVKALEKSFELGNKLDPDRKLELAKALGLKPRQVAIWFQNRRARWKTKQLEKDYDVLKKQFDALKADTDALQAQNNKLTAQLSYLRTKDSMSMVQLLQGTNVPCTKLDQVVQEEGFCHMFNEVDEQQGFWRWGEHQNAL